MKRLKKWVGMFVLSLFAVPALLVPQMAGQAQALELVPGPHFSARTTMNYSQTFSESKKSAGLSMFPVSVFQLNEAEVTYLHLISFGGMFGQGVNDQESQTPNFDGLLQLEFLNVMGYLGAGLDFRPLHEDDRVGWFINASFPLE